MSKNTLQSHLPTETRQGLGHESGHAICNSLRTTSHFVLAMRYGIIFRT